MLDMGINAFEFEVKQLLMTFVTCHYLRTYISTPIPVAINSESTHERIIINSECYY